MPQIIITNSFICSFHTCCCSASYEYGASSLIYSVGRICGAGRGGELNPDDKTAMTPYQQEVFRIKLSRCQVNVHILLFVLKRWYGEICLATEEEDEEEVSANWFATLCCVDGIESTKGNTGERLEGLEARGWIRRKVSNVKDQPGINQVDVVVAYDGWRGCKGGEEAVRAEIDKNGLE